MHEFEIETDIAGHATGFIASYESDKPGPTIGFLAEYDALPGLGHAWSQYYWNSKRFRGQL